MKLIGLLALMAGLVACANDWPPVSNPQPPTPSPLPTWTPAPTAVPHTLFIDAAQDRGPISPFVYGASYGPWVTVTVEMQPLAEA
ncbi:MAG: hypothetical protein ACE5EY_15240, partial [Anaerolineae bacterium]